MNEVPSQLGTSPPVDVAEALLGGAITRLVLTSLKDVSDVSVADLHVLFGGNARRAWSFDLSFAQAGARKCIPCVMLCQAAGRQIDSDVSHEFEVLVALNGRGLRVPQAICMDPAGETIGYPSIVLERLDGEANAVKLLRKLPAEEKSSILSDLAVATADLHRADIDPAELDPALGGLSPVDIVRRQLNHWRAQFEANRQEPLPVLAGLFNWLDDHLPEPERISLVHGDLRPGNFLYRNGRVTGLLDWEMAHAGDPLEDIGWIYRPLWSPEAILPIEGFLERYETELGQKLRPHLITYWRIFSEVKFATISVTASKAFASGETRNIRHADRQSKVAPCLWRSLEWIRRFEGEVRHA
ncbi:phosphotransferase family protein [Xanthobacter versatilis]|uniref:phosphotransferase family protein n=1 Tax=Xanthobacter autotrophicus (strain ATCC BAA-1158 / Py2) TaxID=78245 RepID=UPI003726F37F